MTDLYPQYLQAIRDKVCSVCIERTAEGKCGLASGAVCPIEMYLTRIVTAVHAVSGGDMKRYVASLREGVCAQCPNQGPNGNCPFRLAGECLLNRYFSLIVDAIEEVDERASWPQAC